MKTESEDFRNRIAWSLWFAAFALYLPAIQFDFVNYDDLMIVTERANVFSGISFQNVIWAFTTLHADFAYWMPLTWISHQLDFQVSGPNPGAHHLTNVFLHSANTILLFVVLHRMTRSIWRSACVALLFAWHPLHVETVAWVAERKSLVCSLFWMLTILAYIRYTGFRSWQNYLWVVLGSMGALMGKPMAVTLPFSLLLLDFWPLNRWQSESQDGTSFWEKSTKLVLEKLPLFGVSALGSFMAYLAQKEVGALRENISWPFRISNALAAYWLYIRKTVWPDDLIAIYERHPWPTSMVLWGAIFMGITTAICFRFRKQYSYLLMGWLWYLGNLVPSIGIVPISSHAMADRYSYIPLVGIFIMIAWGIADLAWKHGLSARRVRIGLVESAGVMFLLMAYCTWRQIWFWKDGVTLFTHAVAIAPLSARAHYLLGANLANFGTNDLALSHAKESLRLDSSKAEAFTLVGTILAKTGKFAEAKLFYEKALNVDSNEKQALVGLARLLSTTDASGIRDGVASVRHAALLCKLTRYKYPKYLSILACSYAEVGRFKKAAGTAEDALAIALKTGDTSSAYILKDQLAMFRDGRPIRLAPRPVRKAVGDDD